MDKLILKEIAKRWCKGILNSNDLTYEETAKLLSVEEMDYIQKESFKIANRITKKEGAVSLNECIKEYYEIEVTINDTK